MIQIRHLVREGKTLVIEPFKRTELQEVRSCIEDNQIHGATINIGLAKLHPLDRYCKKSGVRIATQNMRNLRLNFENITTKDDGTIIGFFTVKFSGERTPISLSFKSLPGKEFIHII